MNDNRNDRWALIARNPRLDNLITHLLQSEEGQTLADLMQRVEEARDPSE